MNPPCATCKWADKRDCSASGIKTCNQPDNRFPWGSRPFVRDDFSCPRWERKEDKADKVAKTVADRIAEWTREDLRMAYKGGLILSPQLLAAVIRPLLEEKP